MGQGGFVRFGSDGPPVGDCSQCDAKDVPVHVLSLNFRLNMRGIRPLVVIAACCYQCLMDLGVLDTPDTEERPTS